MRTTAVYGTAMVVPATVVNLLHGVSHLGQEVLSLQAWQMTYVVCVIFVAPIVAAVLLWTSLRLAGAWLLLGSMAGSLVFDLAYHFLVEGPDNAFTLEPGVWVAPFRVTSVLLVVVNGIGVLVGGWAVRRLSRQQTGAPGGFVPVQKGRR
jgi:hypothetical protein